MKSSLLKKITQFLRAHQFNKRWQKLVTVLAVFVVFCTTYMLILPAITMEGNIICGKEEHVHSGNCYIELIKEKELICTEEHEHTDECYEITQTETKLDCGMEEHIHFEACYDKEDLTVFPGLSGDNEETDTTADTTEGADASDTTATDESTTEADTIEGGSDTADVTETTTDSGETTTEITTEADTETTTKATTETTTESTTTVTYEHIHTDDCYTTDETLACVEWGKSEPWSFDWASDEFKDKAVKYVTYLINQIPDITEFEENLEVYDANEDYEAYEDYYLEVYKLVSKAFVNFENLGLELGKEVPNRELLLEYQWIYNGNNTFAITESRTVEFVNYYDNATAYKTVLIHSNSVGDVSSFGFYWWYAVVVDENEYGDLIVTAKYDYNLTNKSNLKPSTSKGFVLLSHGDSNTFDCSVGDEATVSFDYLNATAGYESGGYGTITFSEYVPPEPEEDVEEDITITPDEPSDSQVVDAGGKVTSANKDVIVTKSIDGTELENVFDITLTVQTKTEVQTFLSEPDMAVVIVMDISNTMNSGFAGDTSVSRYDAAVEAASNFINQFAENTSGLSKIGFVAFNTHSHEIFDLQPCSTEAQATALINEMSVDTDAIISASGYADSHNRFTNVEAGLKHGYDMLSSSGNSNQYIVFLSDGFPTTYLKTGTTTYEGYDPYTSSGTKGADGVFYDYVQGKYCSYGTSYSDKASIRAREMATTIKDSGAKIFSIGVDVAGQTIKYYSDATVNYSHSIVDRTSTTYEIGDASSTAAYQNWLKNSIGSGYYYDSNQSDDITSAFNTIFDEIRKLNAQTKKTVWTATDPLPVFDDNSEIVEFIHFFDIEDKPQPELEGTFAVGAEDTAYHEDGVIHWDLKKSGYTTSVDPDDENTTWYYYSVKYRVRLQNELEQFVEQQVYNTNGDAYLEYRTIVTTNDVQQISDTKVISFPKPSVYGYQSELGFQKQNHQGESLEGAVFELCHISDSCPICRGDGTSVSQVTKYVATSNENGAVSFSKIPSGHTYSLVETLPPVGYVTGNGNTYEVVVDYDKITVTERHSDGTEAVWKGDGNDVVANYTGYVLPATGGNGAAAYYIIGAAAVTLSLVLSGYRKRRKTLN